MEAFLVVLAVLASIIGFNVLALRFGVDSRYESNDPHAPAADLTA